MALELTNITQARNNVPFNAADKKPKYVLEPGDCVLVPDEYLAALDEEAQQRFLRVTSGTAPMFSLRRVGSDLSKMQAASAKKAQRKAPKQDVAEPVQSEQVEAAE